MDELLTIYKDRLQIMCILCAQSHTFFNQMKNVMMVTSLLITSTLAILNSISTDLNELKIPNIVLNTFLAFIIALSNQLRFSENGDKFHKLFNAFSKLEHTIDKELNSNTMTPDKLNSIIEKYDLLLETCEGIPGFIKRRIRAKYIESNLPFMINHVTTREREEYIIRTKTLSPNPSFSDIEANVVIQTPA